ncbi:MAG: DUF2259 domain-containing protein [Treponema sp.]|nr:DUF2259 domain-containing protein [Treponema sp.]
MKRFLKSLLGVAFALFSCGAFAGDAAVFSDIGFSEDGLTYIFGQYGKTDVHYEAWAEVYTVDVAKNDFVPNGVFKTKPSAETASFSGKSAFESLIKKTGWYWKKYNCTPSSVGTLLYVRESESKKPTEVIQFKDFESSTAEKSIYYNIQLVPTFYGSGKNLESKFHICMEKKDSEGNLLASCIVGTPEFRRKGVVKYRIDKIFTDKSGKSFVFIVEKTQQDDTGLSIRYMVETVRF